MGPGRLSWAPLLLLHCRRALSAARRSLKPPYSRSLGSAAAALRLCAPQRPPDGRAGGRGRWKGGAGAGGDDDNDNDGDEDEEEEEDEEDDAELEELLGPSPLGPQLGAHRVAVVQPAVRWGPKKPLLTTGGWERRAGGRRRLQPPMLLWGWGRREGLVAIGEQGRGGLRQLVGVVKEWFCVLRNTSRTEMCWVPRPWRCPKSGWTGLCTT